MCVRPVLPKILVIKFILKKKLVNDYSHIALPFDNSSHVCDIEPTVL